MTNLSIAFWGLGSIAKRHIRNLAAVLEEQDRDFSIDVYRHKQQEILEKDVEQIIRKVCLTSDWGNRIYDIVFITNPTSLHYDAIKKCVPYAKAMFIEKPVFDSAARNVAGLNLHENTVYYVACPLRYNAVLQYIKNSIDLSKVISVRAISSSYLPDWRPLVDYRNTYSAHRELGGGVQIDLIHEWDYLTNLFGMPQDVFYVGGRYSTLDIDSNDLAVYIGVYEKLLVELHLDYFGRNTVRGLTLYTDDEVIEADIAGGTIKWLKTGKFISLPEDRDEYQRRELLHFLDIISGRSINDSSITHAANVLEIAEGRGCCKTLR